MDNLKCLFWRALSRSLTASWGFGAVVWCWDGHFSPELWGVCSHSPWLDGHLGTVFSSPIWGRRHAKASGALRVFGRFWHVGRMSTSQPYVCSILGFPWRYILGHIPDLSAIFPKSLWHSWQLLVLYWCERPQKLPLKKERFLECFLGNLSFWVSGIESSLIFYTKNKKN